EAEAYAPDALCAVVDGVLRERGIDRAVWVGNSIGGQLALGAAIAGMPSVAGIVLINATGVDEVAMETLLRRPDELKARAGVARSASLVDAALALMFWDPQGEAARRWIASRTAQRIGAVLRVAVAARHAPLGDYVDRVRVPTLVVWGND